MPPSAAPPRALTAKHKEALRALVRALARQAARDAFAAAQRNSEPKHADAAEPDALATD